MTILVNLNGDFDPITGLPIWDKELNHPDFVLPEITDETDDGKLDVNLTAAFAFATINGAIFSDAANVGSGTGNYSTFLALKDDNDAGDVETGFNAGNLQGPDPNPEDDSNNELDAAKSETILLGAIPIVVINGISYYEFRTDLNENDNGFNPQLSLDQFKLFVGPRDLDPGAGVDLVDTFDELEDLDLVYDMDAGHDISVLMNEATSSGSGTDDYSVLVPVSNFGNLDPATTYVYLFVEMGIADGSPPDTWGVTGGFHEWNLQNAVIIQGAKFNDIDGDGVKDAGEGGVEGVTIYIDDNLDGIVDPTDNNGVLDLLAGERFDITDANGNYSFGGIPLRAADYTIYIREVVPAGSVPTTPLPVAVLIDNNLAAGSIINHINEPDDSVYDIPGLLIGNRPLTPSITITKDASVPGNCANVVGELITYTIVVDNDGELTLTNVVLTDNFEGSGNVVLTHTGLGANGILDPGEVVRTGDTNGNNQMETTETWTYTYVRAVTQAQLDSNGGGNGTLTDVATVNADSANGSVTDNDDATVPICLDPDFTAVKSIVSVVGGVELLGGDPLTTADDAVDSAGDQINYALVIANTGNVTLDGETIIDTFEGAAGNLTSGQFTQTGGVGGALLTNGQLDVGETWTYNFTETVSQAELDALCADDELITNTLATSFVFDGVTIGPKGNTVNTPVVCNPDFTAVKSIVSVVGGVELLGGDPLTTADDAVDSAGDQINYALVIANTGNVTLDGETIIDTFEGAAGNLTSGQFTQTGGVGGALLTNGQLDVGETWTYNFTETVSQAELDALCADDELITNTLATSFVFDGVTIGPKGNTVNTPVVCNPDFTAVKSIVSVVGGVELLGGDPLTTADDAVDSAGDQINYALVIANTGNVTLDGETIIDTFEGAAGNLTSGQFTQTGGVGGALLTNGQLDVGETWTYNFTETVSQAELDALCADDELITNTLATSFVFDGVTIGPKGNTVNTPVVCNPDFTAVKSIVSVVGGVELLGGDPLTTADDAVDSAGDQINYALVIANTGNVTLDGETIIDTFEGAAGNLTSGQFTQTGGVGGALLTNGQLDVGETWTYNFTETVSQAELDALCADDELITNTLATSFVFDGVTIGPKGNTVNTPVVCNPDFTAVKSIVSVVGGVELLGGDPLTTADDAVDSAGDQINYALVIANTGNVTLDGETIIDTFEGAAGNLTSGQFTQTGGVGGALLTNGQLDVGETWTYNFTETVSQAELDALCADDELITNTLATSFVFDGVTIGPKGNTVNTPVVCAPSLTIEKNVRTDTTGGNFVPADSPTGPTASSNTTVDFQVIITNTGNVTLTAITLSDYVHAYPSGSDTTIYYGVGSADPNDIEVNAQVDLDNDGITDISWDALDADGDGTLSATELPGGLAPTASIGIYYSLDSKLGQHTNTATVDTAETGSSSDDANYYVFPSDECVGVGTPGFWSNNGFTFWDGIALNEKHTGDPNVDGDSEPGFADGELLYAVDSNEDGTAGGAGDVQGLLIGDYNHNGLTDNGLHGTVDLGEDTVFITLANAQTLINASNRQINGGQADGIWMLGRDVVATWLNYLANGGPDGDCIGDASDANSPQAYLDGAIDWLQQFASDQNTSSQQQNLANSYHEGDTQALFQFDSKIATSSSVAWQNPFTPGENIPYSGAAMHSALDAYNNTGVINGEEYCCDRDNPLALVALQQLHSDYLI